MSQYWHGDGYETTRICRDGMKDDENIFHRSERVGGFKHTAVQSWRSNVFPRYSNTETPEKVENWIGCVWKYLDYLVYLRNGYFNAQDDDHPLELLVLYLIFRTQIITASRRPGRLWGGRNLIGFPVVNIHLDHIGVLPNLESSPYHLLYTY